MVGIEVVSLLPESVRSETSQAKPRASWVFPNVACSAWAKGTEEGRLSSLQTI